MLILMRLLGRRMLFAFAALLGASALIFIGTEILPGDVAASILGQSATPEALANIRAEWGYIGRRRSVILIGLFGILQGDLGQSLANRQPIGEMISGRLGNTFFLAASTAFVATPLAIILGLIAARYHDRWPDKTLSSSSLAAISLPEFFIAYIFILVFAVKLGWLPSLARLTPQMDFLDRLYAALLPIGTLTLVVMAHMMRMTRAAVLNVMSAPYIETALLKGAPAPHGDFSPRSAQRDCADCQCHRPSTGLTWWSVVVIVEVIFVYPGLGQLMVDHVAKRDIPVVQICGMIFAATYILLNMTADLITVAVNPKLLHPK